MKKPKIWESSSTIYPDIEVSSNIGINDTFKKLKVLNKNPQGNDKVVMAVYTPKAPTPWVKVKARYPLNNLLTVCEYGHDNSVGSHSDANKAIYMNATLRKMQVFGIQSKAADCNSDWFPYKTSCVMLFTQYYPEFMLKSNPVFNAHVANNICKTKKGRMMPVSQEDMNWLNVMLPVWGHRPSDGPIWIQNQRDTKCSWLEHITDYTSSSNETMWAIQPRNCTADIASESTYHILCTTGPEKETPICPAGTKTCDDGSCIVAELWCDKLNHCPLNEDETHCSTADLGKGSPVTEVRIVEVMSEGNRTYQFHKVPSLKGTLYYKCDNGKIIAGSKVCNARDDCGDHSDERCEDKTLVPWCDTALSCDSSKCISEKEKCDLNTVCEAGADEKDCGDYCATWDCGPTSCPIDMLVEKVGLANLITKGCQLAPSVRGNTTWPCSIFNPTYMACKTEVDTPERKECYPRAASCQLSSKAAYCSGQADHSNCDKALCPGQFKCYNSFCIDMDTVCDGRRNCPSGEDEMLCKKYDLVSIKQDCRGKFRCKNKCIDLKHVCDRQKDCDEGEDEEICRSNCPKQCECVGMSMSCYGASMFSLPPLTQEMRILLLSYNHIPFHAAVFADFPRLIRLDMTSNGITSSDIQHNFNTEQISNKKVVFGNLRDLILRRNNITVISSFLFSSFGHVTFLDLRENPLQRLEKYSFSGLSRLSHLYLEETMLEDISDNAFTGLSSLRLLNLSHNNIQYLSETAFEQLDQLNYLDLRFNPLELVHEKTFVNLLSLMVIHTPGFQYCCVAFAHSVQCTHPPIEYSNCSDLLASSALRFCIWILALVAFIGNVAVICWRKKDKKEQTPLSFIIQNLGVADLLMGVYLLIIAVSDVVHKGNYYLYDSIWRRSIWCRIAGFVSMLSSEMSVYVLCLITADRIAVIALGWQGMTRRVAQSLVMTGWVVWSVLSLLPIINLEYFGSSTYIKHGVCFLFNLTEGKVTGWEYATAIFIGFNMFALIFLGVGYTGTFISIICRTGFTGTMEAKIARKLLLVVITDCLCWIPPIVIGIMSLQDQSVDSKVAVWVAILIFPINSSLNPFLYTCSTMSCDDDKGDDFEGSSESYTRWNSHVDDIGLRTLQNEIDEDNAKAMRVNQGENSDYGPSNNTNRRRTSRTSKMKNTWSKNQRVKQMVSDAVLNEATDASAAGTSGTSSQMQIDLSMSVAIRGNVDEKLADGEAASIASITDHTISLSRSRSLKVRQTTQINTVSDTVHVQDEEMKTSQCQQAMIKASPQ